MDERYFTLTSIINTFNSLHCWAITPYDDSDIFKFVPIFLRIMDADLRLDAVELLYDKKKKSLGANFRFLSEEEVGDPVSYVHNIPYNDARLWKNNALVVSIFTSTMTAFSEPIKETGETVVMDYRDTPPYVFFRKTPKATFFDEYTGLYDVISDAVLNAKMDNPSGNYTRYNMYPSVVSVDSEAERKRTATPIRQRIANAGATVTQQKMLRLFLYGFPVGKYIDDNIKKDGEKYVFNPTSRPAWDKAVKGLVAKVVAQNKDTDMEKLTDYVRHPSKTESSLPIFGSLKDVGDIYEDPVEDAGNDKLVESVSEGDDDSVSDADGSASVSDDDGSSASDDGSQDDVTPVENNVPAKTPSTTPIVVSPVKQPTAPITTEPGHINLRRLYNILEKVRDDQKTVDSFWALSKFLNAFNAFFCSEVSPYQSSKIEPIYVTIGKTKTTKAPHRLYSVTLSSNTFRYAFVDSSDTLSVYEQDDDNLVSAIESDATTKAFDDHVIVDKTGSFTVSYTNRRPLYGEIRRYYASGVFGTWDRCWDSNGLDLLIGYGTGDGDDGRWHVDSRYVKITLGTETNVGDRPKRIPTKLTTNQQTALRAYLFGDGPVEKAALKKVLNGAPQWTAEYIVKDISGWMAILDVVEIENPIIYKQIAPNGHRFPVPTREADIDFVFSKLQKAKDLLAKVDQLDRAVEGLKKENEHLKSELDEARANGNVDENALQTELGEAKKTIASNKKLMVALEKENNALKVGRDDALSETATIRKQLDTMTTERDRLRGEAKLDNDYYLAAYKLLEASLNEVNGEPDEKGLISFNLVQFENNYNANLDEIDQLKAKLKEDTDNLGAQKNAEPTQFTTGLDVIASNASFSRMIRENVFKGKYSAELSVISSSEPHAPVLHMKFDNIGTYTDENNKRLVYGARCSKNTRHTSHTKNKNRLPANIDPTSMKVCVKDEYGNVIKQRMVALAAAPDDGHSYMLKCDDTRVYMTRSSETGELGVKMLIVDV